MILIINSFPFLFYIFNFNQIKSSKNFDLLYISYLTIRNQEKEKKNVRGS